MTVYKYLGYGVTNENGVAKLEYNSEGQKIDHSYTGVGAGEIDVVASLDKPITDGSIVSEPYNVLDCTVYDDMETEHINYYTISNNSNISYSTEWALGGNSLKWDYDNTGASTTKYWGWQFMSNPSTNYFDLDVLKGKNFMLEMDINSEVDFIDAQNKGFYIQTYYKETSSSTWNNLTNALKIYSNQTSYQIPLNIPSEIYALWIRINANTNCPSGVLYTDNWRLYPI